MSPMTLRPPRWRRLAPLLLLTLAAAAAFATFGDRLSFAALRDNRAALLALAEAHPALTGAGFVLAYAAIVALSLPGAAIASLTGGFLFGLFPGTLYNVAGATLGATAVFLAVRYGLAEGVRARIDAGGDRLRRIAEELRANEVAALLTLRLIPAVPFFLVNLAAAAFGVAAWRFVWTTAVGILPGAAVYTWAGQGLGAVFDRGEAPDPGLIFEPRFLLPLLALAALSALPVVLRLVRGR
jgi:uncharacterized membrane protein YdjX (TVP38/TMEM64 family)